MLILTLLTGFFLLLAGASWLVDGAASIAKRLGVSHLAIGLTVVAFGTSAPELVVNMVAAVKGNTDIALGNIIGSNIANVLLILGCAALVRPLLVKESTVRIEIPLSILASALLLPLGAPLLSLPFDGATAAAIGRLDGIVLIILFVFFMRYIFRMARNGAENDEPLKEYPLPTAIFLTVCGIGALPIGGEILVRSAAQVAAHFGISERVIGLSLVAVGTSLPELATSLVAAYKKNADIAVGNIVGSNIFNVFWILGISSLIRPLPVSGAGFIDIGVATGASLLLFLLVFRPTDRVISRRNGIVFLVSYGAYLVFLFLGRAT